MKYLKMFAVVLAFAASPAFSHEGHNHNPGAVAAPHGGLVESTASYYVELVAKGDGIQLFVFDHDMKAVGVKELQVEGTMTLPRKKKGEAVKFKPEGEGFSAKVDAKGSHRYTLDLAIQRGAKKEKVKFNVEPQ